MLAAGERLKRVPPKMMAHARESARTYGKSDPIDALAVARAALREPHLPTAYLDETAREVRLLVDHLEDLIGERTRHINRLRWHLHEIDPTWDPKQRALTTMKHLAQTQRRLEERTTVVAKIAADLVDRIRALTIDINTIEAELDQRTTAIASALREVHGVAASAPRSSSAKSPASASTAGTLSRGTTGRLRLPCGQATPNATDSAAPATVNSTPRSTAWH